MLRLVETFQSGLKPVLEGKGTGRPRLYLEGVGQSTKPNRNNRVYPREVWEYMFNEDKDYLDRLSRGRLLGGLGHPKDGIFDPMNSCLVLREQFLDGDDVQVRLECVLDTPGGQVIKALADVGVELGVSSRGGGDAEERNGYLYVLPGFYLEGYDAVVDPSVAHANPNYVKDVRRQLENFSKKADAEGRYMAMRIMESFTLPTKETSSIKKNESVVLTYYEVRKLESYIRSLERKIRVNRK
jgi:hypothetical protein